MIYVIALIAAAVIIIGAGVVRRQGSKRRLSYAPDQKPIEEPMAHLSQVTLVPMLTPVEATEELVHRETVEDVSDDLLAPSNPNHAQFVHQHPDLETDEEWIADHPGDAPT